MTDFGKFKAAMFDYDGTLTNPGVWEVDKEVAATIGQLLVKNFPIAVCTGRQIESFEKRFGEMIDFIRDEFGDEVLSNLYLMAENGAVGYEYKKGKWEMFYIAKWPKEISRDDFEKKLYELVKDKAEILSHLVPIVIAPLGRLQMKFEDIKKKSAEIFKIAKKFIKDYGAEDYLHIGDSGLGCLICPADGDKDTAIKIFYEFLKDKKSIKFESDGKCREILAVGDNPQKSGNDYYFLNGKYGTPFTVGSDHENGGEFPLKVFDNSGRQLFNEEGALCLLNQIESGLN